MRLTRLELRDWLSFASLDLDLSAIEQGVITGPNGHGKSALLDAVQYALFGSGRASPNSMIRQGAIACWVRLTLDLTSTNVVITRTRSMESKAGETSLQLEVGGQRKTKHTIAETQREIDRLLGLSQEALFATAFMTQGRSDELMRASPASRKEYLLELFGIGFYDALHEQAKDQATVAFAEARQAEQRVADLLPDADVMDERTRIVGSLITESRDVDKRIDGLTEQAQSLREELATLDERQKRVDALTRQINYHNTFAASVNARMVRVVGQVADGYSKMHRPGPVSPRGPGADELAGQVRDARANLEASSAAKARMQQLNKDLTEARRAADLVATVPCHAEGIYAACPFLVTAKDAGRINALEAERAGVGAQVDPGAEETYQTLDLEWAKARRAELDFQTAQAAWAQLVSSTQEQITHWEEEIEAAKDEHRKALEDVATLQRERLPLQQDVHRGEELQERVQRVVGELEAATVTRKTLTDRIATANVALEISMRAEKELGVLLPRIRSRKADADVYAILAKAFHRDGIPTLILEHGIPQIEAAANETLARMPGSFAIELRTQRQTKTAGLKDTLDIVVVTDGLERDYGLLSGGERFRVDFALRVALATVLAHRAGTTVETVWLDEPLAALDAPGRQSVVESLAAVADQFPLILLSSHHDDVSDLFPTRIEVSKESGESVVTVA